jgi:hypothetical protein
MPADYDMYFDYKNEYNEDDFFYHMYFDEVSTTPLPDEFYDILHSVKASSGLDSPDYASLLSNRKIGRQNITLKAAAVAGGSPTWVAAAAILEDAAATADPDPVISTTQFNVGRNVTQFGRRAGEEEGKEEPRAARNSKQSRWRRSASSRNTIRRTAAAENKKKHPAAATKKGKGQNLKWTLSSKGTRRREQARRRRRKKKKQKQDPRIVGILDLRVPAYFKTNIFVPILLESFIVLSTGVAPAGRTRCKLYPSPTSP